jgi:2-(1,2-epoxy-1,2-dihydrophenyl)acetyl-CoA isomerase
LTAATVADTVAASKSGSRNPNLIKERSMADLLESIEDGVAVLTLNRPEALNALSMDIRNGLISAMDRYADDSNVRCIVITGAGRAFSSGGDVKGMGDRAARGYEARARGIQFSNSIPMAMRKHPKVINGVAAGAGMSMSMACDMRIAGKSARFTTAFLKIGLSGDWGGTWTLTRLVGTAKARELFLMPDMVGADEALRIGLVNRVVEDAELRGATMEIARRIAEMPQVAVAAIKRNLFSAETDSFATTLDQEAFNQARCSQTEDHVEAVTAFKEKRKPVFKGR